MSNNTPRKRFKARLEALNRRADYLKDLSNKSGYDRQELSAIVWAINVIEDFPSEALQVIRYEAPKGEGEQR